VSEFRDAHSRRGEAVNSCTPRDATGPYFAGHDSPPTKKDSTMQADTAVTTELPKLNLPQDLLTEVKRGGPKARTDFGVEGLNKPSLFGRLVEKLLGGKGAR
jgi:hypothetical protein